MAKAKKKPKKAAKRKPVKKARKKPVKKRSKPVSMKKPAKKAAKPAKKAMKKAPRKAVSRKPARRKARKPKTRTITLAKMKRKPVVRVRVPSPKELSEKARVKKQDEVMHRATHLAVEDIAKLTRFKLTDSELDRLSRDVEKMIKAFEGLEKLVIKRKKGR